MYICFCKLKNINKMQEIEIKMVDTENAKMMYKQVISNFGSLGKEVKISPKANVTINKAGYEQKFLVDSVSVTIGIGNDYVADLVMTREAWEALKAGEEIHITTTKEFKKKFL